MQGLVNYKTAFSSKFLSLFVTSHGAACVLAPIVSLVKRVKAWLSLFLLSLLQRNHKWNIFFPRIQLQTCSSQQWKCLICIFNMKIEANIYSSHKPSDPSTEHLFFPSLPQWVSGHHGSNFSAHPALRDLKIDPEVTTPRRETPAKEPTLTLWWVTRCLQSGLVPTVLCLLCGESLSQRRRCVAD